MRKQTGQPTNTQEIINLTNQPGNQRTNQPNEQTTQSSNQARKHAHRLKQRKTQSHEECRNNAVCCRSRLGPSLAAGHKVSLCDWNVQPFGICAKYYGQNKCLCTVIQEFLLQYLFLNMLLVLHICAHACGMQAFMKHSSTKVLLPASKKDNGCRKQGRRRCRVGLKRSSGCLAESWKRLGNSSKEVPKPNRSLVLDLISDRSTTIRILP